MRMIQMIVGINHHKAIASGGSTVGDEVDGERVGNLVVGEGGAFVGSE